MTENTLAHDLMTLSISPATGRRRKVQAMRFGLGGALLAELALAGRIDVRGRKVTVLDPSPTGRPLPDRTLARVVGERERAAQSWVPKIGGPATAEVLADLQRWEIVSFRENRVLFVLQRTYPLVEPRVAERLIDELRALAEGTRTPSDQRRVALLCLLYAAQLHRDVLPDVSPKLLKNRIAEWGRMGILADATHQVIAATRQAAVAAQVIM